MKKEDRMFCPCCEHELVERGEDRYESLCEHVSDPNGTPSMKMGYGCPNEKCDASKVGCIWIEMGEGPYNGKNYKEARDIKWIDDNDGPFNTLTRQQNIEIYKKGLKKGTGWFTFLYWGFNIEYNYKSNYEGEVLGRSYKLKVGYTDDRSSYTIWKPGIYMAWWSIKHNIHTIKQYRDPELNTEFWKGKVKEIFDPLPTWEHRPYRMFTKWYFNFFYSKLKKEVYE